MGIIAASQQGSPSVKYVSPAVVDKIETKSLLDIQNICPININKIIKANSRILNLSHILMRLFLNI